MADGVLVESHSIKDEMGSHQKLSGMQKQVLGLYRGFLRAARMKTPDERRRIESIISNEFRQNGKNVDRKNFLYIEYLMRRGKKQLEQLNSPDIVGLSTLNVTSSATNSAQTDDSTLESTKSCANGTGR